MIKVALDRPDAIDAVTTDPSMSTVVRGRASSVLGSGGSLSKLVMAAMDLHLAIETLGMGRSVTPRRERIPALT